jgi:arginase family enzyme
MTDTPAGAPPPARDPLPVFAGLISFARAPVIDRSQLQPGTAAVAGAPYDLTSTSRVGARFGPRLVRENSTYFGYHSSTSGTARLHEVSTDDVLTFSGDTRLFDVGDLNIYPADLDKTERSFAEGIGEIVAAGAFPVIIGGDRYVTRPLARGFRGAFAARGEADAGVVLVWGRAALGDAHAGWGPAWGSATGRRMLEDGTIDADRAAWLGVSGWHRAEEAELIDSRGLHVRSADEVAADVAGVAAEALDRVSPDGRPVLLAIDVDVLDGVFAPGSSEPRFTGLDNRALPRLVDALADPRVKGLVITGVNPSADPSWTVGRLVSVLILRAVGPLVLDDSRVAAAANERSAS